MKIGILALQGAFIEHKYILDKLNVDSFEIRQKKDLVEMDALIIPGGESTVIGKLLKDLDLFDEIKDRILNGLPTFGTCAGMILLAKKIYNDETKHLEILDIEVKRNAYGRQLGSFKCYEKFDNIENLEMVYIRAPYVENILSNDVKVLSIVDEKITAVRQKNILATSFHPELTNDTRVHEYFIEMIKEIKNGN